MEPNLSITQITQHVQLYLTELNEEKWSTLLKNRNQLLHSRTSTFKEKVVTFWNTRGFIGGGMKDNSKIGRIQWRPTIGFGINDSDFL